MGFFGIGLGGIGRWLDPTMHNKGRNVAAPVRSVPITGIKPKKEAVVLVYEGVLASTAWRDEYLAAGDYAAYCMLAKYDEPNPNIAKVMSNIGIRDDVKIIVISTLPVSYKDSIAEWLNKNEIRFDSIYCRYNASQQHIDEARKSSYTTHIRHDCDVQLVFESIPSCYEMWMTFDLRVIMVEDPEVEPLSLPDPNQVLSEIDLTKKAPTKWLNGPADRCNDRIGPPESHTFCNKEKNHGGACGWNNQRDAVLKAQQSTKTAPVLPGPDPADKVLPAIQAMCGNLSGGNLVCIRMANHEGTCRYAPPDAKTDPIWTEAEVAEMYGMGWGGWGMG